MAWLIGIGAAVLGIAVFLIWRRRRQTEQLVSIVMLRAAPRRLSESEARGAIRRAWQGLHGDIDVMQGPSPDPQSTGTFVVALNGAPVFYIIDAARPYEDDPGETAMQFEHRGAREAYAGHQAWLSVDIVGGMPPKDMREVIIAILGRIAAELLDEQCTLIFAPALQRFALPSAETEEKLRSGMPLEIFGDSDVNTPIIRVGSDDERVNRAMEEARRQWPKFVEIWRRSGQACSPIVKGRFEHPNGNEYMWIEVTGVDSGTVTGVLVNEPAHVTSVATGQTVTVAVDDVVDWACRDGEEPVGMFVEKILRRG